MTTAPDRLASELSTELLLEMYRRMRLIRRFEERAIDLYKAAEMAGTVHPAIGQEAVSVGTCFTLRPDDCIVTTHRGHADVLAKGAPVDRVMAELFGRATGVCKGKGGSMHVADLSKGIVGANGIVGAGLPIAHGVALGFKLRGLDRIVVSFFSDGATDQGAFHETLNMANLWTAPLVFVCHNNQYATCVPRHQHQRAAQIADFARAHNMPGVTVDGNDVLAVYEAVRAAVDRARTGGGPTLVECMTFRWTGHHAGDNHWLYRTREEVEPWFARDPLKIHRARLVGLDAALEAALDRIDAEADAVVEAAVDFARQSPWPAPEAADEDLYVGYEVR